jgi:heme/copper-type cytochrome/quinol oxidase subunit 3
MAEGFWWLVVAGVIVFLVWFARFLSRHDTAGKATPKRKR